MSDMYKINAFTYEEHLLVYMAKGASLKQALMLDFIYNKVDITNVFDLVEYLEEKLEDLDKVKFYMDVYTNQSPDLGLKAVT